MMRLPRATPRRLVAVGLLLGGIGIRVVAQRFPEAKPWLDDGGLVLAFAGPVLALYDLYVAALASLEQVATKVRADVLMSKAQWPDGIREAAEDGIAQYIRLMAAGFPLRTRAVTRITARRCVPASEVPSPLHGIDFLVFRVRDSYEFTLPRGWEWPDRFLPLILVGKPNLLDVETWPRLAHPTFRLFAPVPDEIVDIDSGFRQFEFLRDPTAGVPWTLPVTLSVPQKGTLGQTDQLVHYVRFEDETVKTNHVKRALERAKAIDPESEGLFFDMGPEQLLDRVFQLYVPSWKDEHQRDKLRPHVGTRLTCTTDWEYWLPVGGRGMPNINAYYAAFNAPQLTHELNLSIEPGCGITWDGEIMNVHYRKIDKATYIDDVHGVHRGREYTWEPPALLMTGHGYGFRWRADHRPGDHNDGEGGEVGGDRPIPRSDAVAGPGSRTAAR